MNFHDPDAETAGAILTIDLGALADNWRLLAAKHANNQCAAVVKADAYGVGVRPAGKALHAAGCRIFFVAHPTEGVRLRKVLPDVEIHVLNGFCAPATVYLDHDLIPVLNSLDQIRAWADLSKARGGGLPADIHVDTGMRRLGLPRDELAALAADPGPTRAFRPKYLMTHLACADEPAHPLNAEQLKCFRRVRTSLRDIPFEGASMANSSGIFLGPDYHADLPRPGVALYGSNPTPGRTNPMAQVIRLEAKILQVRAIDSPETVGYGATFRARGPMRVATVAAGYADGFLRAASGRASGHRHTAFMGDRPVPLLGRISMDLIVVDVTAIDPAEAREGAYVDLIGPNNDIDSVARAAGTIGYEVLTGLGTRYHRQFPGHPDETRGEA